MRARSLGVVAACLFAGASLRCGQTGSGGNGGGGSAGGGGGSGTHKVIVTLSGPGSVRSSPAGIDCGATCSASFADGSIVTLSAEPATGATFSGWSGACTGTGDCSIKVTADTVATATFVGSPPDECAGLRPPMAGPAPLNHSIQRRSPTGNDFCLPGLSDGAGTLALILGASGMNNPMSIDFVSSSSGALLGQRSGGGVFLTGQPSGFIEASKVGSFYWLEAWDTTGRSVARTSMLHVPIDIAPDETRGGVSAAVDSPLNGLESYDDHLNRRWRTALPAEILFAFAVDRAGQTLLLFNGNDRYGADTVAGTWVDRDGTAGAVFKAFGAQPHLGQVMTLVLTQRVGSGLFVGLSKYVGAKGDVTWVGQIDSLATSVEPAPAWLQARPNTSLHMVHGGTGYAVMSLPGSSANCTQAIEVLAPSGTSCGAAIFSAGSGSCDMKSIVVGYDGTVIQSLPDSIGQQCSFGPCACTWQWWPGFFR